MKSLVEYLTDLFRKNIEEEIKKEKADPKYLPQEAFRSCRARAKALLDRAVTACEDFMTMAVAEHRMESHGEDYAWEKDQVDSYSALSKQDKIDAKSRGFWN